MNAPSPRSAPLLSHEVLCALCRTGAGPATFVVESIRTHYHQRPPPDQRDDMHRALAIIESVCAIKLKVRACALLKSDVVHMRALAPPPQRRDLLARGSARDAHRALARREPAANGSHRSAADFTCKTSCRRTVGAPLRALSRESRRMHRLHSAAALVAARYQRRCFIASLHARRRVVVFDVVVTCSNHAHAGAEHHKPDDVAQRAGHGAPPAAHSRLRHAALPCSCSTDGRADHDHQSRFKGSRSALPRQSSCLNFLLICWLHSQE